MNCRHCAATLRHVFLDLGFAPPSNAYLTPEKLHEPELYFPLKLYVCEQCWLVQTEDYSRADELFSEDYAYFSSVSHSWLEHAQHYSAMITERLGLNKNSLVIEIAANDGYLLKNFVAAGVPCLGIEPTASTAAAAKKIGVPIVQEFFTEEMAGNLVAQGQSADLIIGNNVYAHVPDINDFTRGMKKALKPGGTITLEFPHLMRLIEHAQFDTVYHEHFSYLSLYTVSRIFESAGLQIWDVEELATHGGSLRVYGCHADDARPRADAVDTVLAREKEYRMRELSGYADLQGRAERVKDELLMFLIEQKRTGKRVAAYGAAAKGNTLLNFAGIRADLLPFICDEAPSKQGKYTPGMHIPILSTTALRDQRPDSVLILPWNIADEVQKRHMYVREWGAAFYVIKADEAGGASVCKL